MDLMSYFTRTGKSLMQSLNKKMYLHVNGAKRCANYNHKLFLAYYTDNLVQRSAQEY